MKTLTLLWTKLGVFCTAFVLALAGVAPAATYTVTTAVDHPVNGAITIATATGVITGGAGNGLVTLRSAVIAANKNGAGPHTINVPAALGTYNLNQVNPDSPATTSTGGLSDLQVGSNLSTVIIQGTGGTAKIVQTITNPVVDVITTGFKDASYNPAVVNLTLDQPRNYRRHLHRHLHGCGRRHQPQQHDDHKLQHPRQYEWRQLRTGRRDL